MTETTQTPKAHIFYIDASIQNTIGYAAKRGNVRAVMLLAAASKNDGGELERAYNHVATIEIDRVEPTFTMMQNLEEAWTDNNKISVTGAVKAALDQPTRATSLFARSMMVGDAVVITQPDGTIQGFVCAPCGWNDLDEWTARDLLDRVEKAG